MKTLIISTVPISDRYRIGWYSKRKYRHQRWKYSMSTDQMQNVCRKQVHSQVSVECVYPAQTQQSFHCGWVKLSAAVTALPCGRNTYWGLSWLCLWLLMGGSAALLLNSSPFLKVSLICSVSVNTWRVASTLLLPWPWWHRESGCGRAGGDVCVYLITAAPTFVGEPARLRSDADGTAVLLVLRRATQIVPHALCADAAQVWSLRLNALVHSLLLGRATRRRNH